MSTSYTHGKLVVGPETTCGYVEGYELPINLNGQRIGAVDSEDDARRLVACWNACIGWSTEYLEHPENPGFMARMDQIASVQAIILAQAQELINERNQLRAECDRLRSDAQGKL